MMVLPRRSSQEKVSALSSRPAAVGQLDLQPLVGKEAQAHGGVLGGVEHGVGHLVEPEGHGLGRFFSAGAQGEKQQGEKQQGQYFLHAITPK